MLRPFLCASSAVIERPAEKLAIRKTKRMTTVIDGGDGYVAAPSFLLRRRLDGWSNSRRRFTRSISQRQQQRDHHDHKHHRTDDEKQPPEPAEVLRLWATRVERVVNAATRRNAQHRSERRADLQGCVSRLDHCGGGLEFCGISRLVRCSERRAFMSSLRVGETSLRSCPLIERT